jgi:hypothetical protein
VEVSALELVIGVPPDNPPEATIIPAMCLLPAAVLWQGSLIRLVLHSATSHR